MRRRSYLNAVLSVIAICLVALTLDRLSDHHEPGQAFAQPATNSPEPTGGGGLVAAADQRKAMIGELRNLSTRLERIEAQLSRGITVKVSEMPDIKFPKDAK
jgi:hypothetical protein